MVNQSLSQIQQLAVLQQQDAIKKNRQSLIQNMQGEAYTSMISYFGAQNVNESTVKRGKKTKRSTSRKNSKHRGSMSAQATLDDLHKQVGLIRESITPIRCIDGSREECDGKTISFSEMQVEEQPDMSQYKLLQSLGSPGKTR